MPKSRGRKTSHRKPQRRQPPRSWQAEAVAFAAELVDPEVTRTGAELLASEAMISRPVDVPARERDSAAVRELVAYATRRRSTAAAALVAALALVVDQAEVQAALDEWARPLVAELPWVTAPAAHPPRASRATDPWDDDAVYFLEYDDVALVAQTSRAMGGAVSSIGVAVPDVTQKWDAEETWPRAEMPLADALADLRRAFDHTEMWWPPNDDADYQRYRVFLSARLRTAGAERGETEWEPMEEDQREQLLDRFFADVELPDDELTRELADLCLTFADGWVMGGALTWSPAVVERFLLDWVPRRTYLDGERQRLLPSVTFAWVGWALIERGVDRAAAAEAAAVALELAEDFAAEYDEAEKSPATELAHRMLEEGVDVTDREAVDAVIGAYNAERNARRLLEGRG